MADYERVAIVGTGTMGPGIGAVLARAGSQVSMYDVDPKAIEKAEAGVQLANSVLDRLEVKNRGGSVTFSADRATALDGTDLVIEAIPEKLDLKKAVFAELEALVAAHTVLASNTSGIPITAIAEDLNNPERVIGMHWSNPPHLIPMIEVVPGEATSDTTRDDLKSFIQSFGYEAVVEREVPGFVENRILYAILRECVELVDKGIISQADMDTCVRWGIGYKLAVIGPMELLDMAGLDIYQSVGSYLNADLSTASDVSALITDLIANGHLGMKAGRGIYDYTPESIAEKTQYRAEKLVAVRKALEA